jgi:hypothetical protein
LRFNYFEKEKGNAERQAHIATQEQEIEKLQAENE